MIDAKLRRVFTKSYSDPGYFAKNRLKNKTKRVKLNINYTKMYTALIQIKNIRSHIFINQQFV